MNAHFACMTILVTNGAVNGIYPSTTQSTLIPTFSIILLIEQGEDFNIPLPQMTHVVLESLHAILHTRKRHKRLSARSLQTILSNHDRRLSIRSSGNDQRSEEIGDVFLGGLSVRK